MPNRTKTSVKQRRQALWDSLNDRQQTLLRIIYNLDQEKEEARRAAGARGNFSNRPASEWRQIDFTHEPYNRELFGLTTLQSRLETAGYHNQGNGSTMKVLAQHGLVEYDMRGTRLGIVHTVRLTSEGRAVYRVGTDTGSRASTGTVELSERSWEVLGSLWAAHTRDEPLKWPYSTTIEHVLITKHAFAERVNPQLGYRITDTGRTYYREHWAEYASVYPSIRTQHPDGVDLWPKNIDTTLDLAAQRCDSLATAWRDAWTVHTDAAERTTRQQPAPRKGEQPEVAEMAAERHALAVDAAQREAELAERHMKRLNQLSVDAAWAYARMAAAVFSAAVEHTDPRAALKAAAAGTTRTLPTPAATGWHGTDTDAVRLHAAAIGRPLPRKSPPPRQRTRRRDVPEKEKLTPPPAPSADLVAYADFLGRHVRGGQLQRILHADRLAPDEEGTGCARQP